MVCSTLVCRRWDCHGRCLSDSAYLALGACIHTIRQLRGSADKIVHATVQHGGLFAMVNGVLIPNHNQSLSRSTQMLLGLLCVWFLAMSVALPAYSAQKTLQIISTSLVNDIDGTAMPSVSDHHKMTTQHSHVGSKSTTPCSTPGCDNQSDCTDNCTMSTCCTSVGASNMLSHLHIADHHGETVHRLTNALSVISRRLEPLFRPPIQ